MADTSSGVSTCPSCKLAFGESKSEPRELPCGHVSCLGCAERIQSSGDPSSSSSSSSSPPPDAPASRRCPLCDISSSPNVCGPSSLPLHVGLLDACLRGTAAAHPLPPTPGPPPRCSECLAKHRERPSTHRCSTCSASFCDGHATVHQEDHEDHDVSALPSSSSSSSSSSPSRPLVWPRHDRPLELYCEQCDEVICLK